RRVLLVVRDVATEEETDGGLQRELRNPDEAELDLRADARPDVEEEAAPVDVAGDRRAGRQVLRFLGARREPEVELRDEQELVVFAVREGERHAAVDDESERGRSVGADG